MAMHTDLPIHKVAFDLLSLATDITRNIPRDLKAGLGAKVRDECIEVMVLIARANAARDKQQHLGTLVERVQVIEFLLRLFKEKRFISIAQHASAIELTASIGRQANAWKRRTATAYAPASLPSSTTSWPGAATTSRTNCWRAC